MDYFTLINNIFYIVGLIFSLFFAHFALFAIIGIFARKKFPKAKIKHKYGLIIPARNEEAVIGNLIKSMQKQNYPQELLQIFVIAHNCTDKTAEIARELGATVYEYDNPNERTMGYAFRHLFKCIEQDYGTQNYDGFFLFNADNILAADYIDKMNNAFDAGECKNVVTSFRNSKNFGSNIMSGLYGIYFMVGCRLESRGRSVCGCSTRVQGTGYVIPADIVKDGWPYVTLTEDWEFSADQVLHGRKIVYCDDAVFYDEQPTTIKVMLKQRLRWARGHLLVCLTRGKVLFKSLFKRTPKGEKSYKFSKYDIFVNSMPYCAVNVLLWVLNFLLIALTPLFGVDAAVFWKEWGITFGTSIATGYLSLMLQAVVILIVEHKRIKNVNWFKKILIALFWPIFLFLSFPLEVVALFCKNLGWSKIPHTDTTNFESLNQNYIEQEQNQAEQNSENTTETIIETDAEISEENKNEYDANQNVVIDN